MQEIDVKKNFGFEADFKVFGNKKADEFCPAIDPDYIFEQPQQLVELMV